MRTNPRTHAAAIHQGVTMTLDVEAFAPEGGSSRHVELTLEILEALAQRSITASIFVVGEVASAHPELVTAIVESGHELGLHAHRHVALEQIGRDAFLEETRVSKDRLEQLSGAAVLGYRAPMMSLVPSTAWAIPMITTLGFSYSSSVLPARSPHFGWPGLPAEPFRWKDGPVELPCPVVRIGSNGIPFLGGTYLRLLPWTGVRLLRRLAGPHQLLWSYCHPYEFDPDEPRWIDPSVGKYGSWMLWYGRRHTWRNLDRVGRYGHGATLAERVAALPRSLPLVDPESGRRI